MSLAPAPTATTIPETDTSAMRLWHFTCADHGLAGIEAAGGVIEPNVHPLLPELGAVIWLTEDEALADPEAIGFIPGEQPWRVTNDRWLRCDRTAVRYEVPTAGAMWWPFVRGRCDARVVRDLEHHGKPHTWWVLFAPVTVDRPIGRTIEGAVAVEATERRVGVAR
jgi:hypothetical protein